MQHPEKVLSKDWDRLMNRVPGMQGHESVENSRNNGTPDKSQTVLDVNSWAELKIAQEPKKDTTCVKLPHWSQLQRRWMQARMTCPTVFLVVRIGEWDYIFDTHSMFTIETTPYVQLKKHPWRVKIGVADFWGYRELQLLSDKLRGVDSLRIEEEKNNGHKDNDR